MRPLIQIAALFCFSFIAIQTQAKPIQQANIDFYTTQLNIQYDQSMLKKNKHCTSTICIKRFYKRFEETNYQILLDNLLAHKETLKLNDWFFYTLVRKAMEHVYEKESDMFRTSATWFMLTKAGYDTRLYTSKSKYTFLYVRTEDQVFEIPFIKIKGQHYANLTAVYYGIKTRGIFFEIPKYQPGQLNNKPFSFTLGEFPELPSQTIEKTYSFSVDTTEIEFTINVDTLGNALMDRFPITAPINYIRVPISNTTLTSLKDALNPYLEGKSDIEKLKVLLSFTRKAFPYTSDQIRFRRDQPLTADQLMVADSSDYEDRCALFYNLLKETTDLNFVVIQYMYDDIITIAVDLPEPVGKPFEFEGKRYTVCDPTMPANSSKLGLYPIRLDKDIEVVEIVEEQMTKR